LLNDGRVLIAGGEMLESRPDRPRPFRTLSSAELYDPGTGMFSVTGNMTMRRLAHTATLLPNGSVLIAGGGFRDGSGGSAFISATADIYDPVAGTFTRTGDMTEARWSHTATLLNNGQVLIAGGARTSAELYDPATGLFTATGAMTEVSAWTATLLVSGKVLITRTTGKLYNADLYDPATGTFSGTGGLDYYHNAPTATLLTNGKVLVAGGDIGDGDGPSDVAELYDPDSETFARTGDLIIGREQHSATVLPDGSVLFAGGHNTHARAATAEIYDPVLGKFSSTGSLPTARELHSATLLADGSVLMAGGDDERYWMPETILSSAILYSPEVAVPAPVLLSLSGHGNGQGAILHANTPRIASSDNPAAVGDALEIYLTGLVSRSVIPPHGRLAAAWPKCCGSG
jgi:hypothetical protein